MILIKADHSPLSYELTNLAYSKSSLPPSRKLYPGMNIYDESLDVDTFIESVDTVSNKVVINKYPLTDGTQTVFDFSALDVGVYHERNCALIDSQNVIVERGMNTIWSFRNTETSQIVRDKYNSMARMKDNSQEATVEQWNIKTYPLVDSPDRDTLTSNGLKEDADVIATFATKELKDRSLNVWDIDKIRTSISIQGHNYEIREIGRVNQFADTFLNFTLGLQKK